MGMWDIPARRVVTDTELRFNPYHDPRNGRFTTANGGGSGGGFLYSKGGKSAYVFERDIDSEYEAWKALKSGNGIVGKTVDPKNGRPEVTNVKGDDYFVGATTFSIERGGYVPFSVGYTPSQKLPEVEAVSEKQKKYAEDLRNQYINGRTGGALNRIIGAYGAAKYDDDKINSTLKKAGFDSLDDFKNKYIENDTVKYLMTEKSARNIIDRVKNSR